MYQNHTDGILHGHLRDKRVWAARKSDEYLHIELADANWKPTGETIKVGWVSDGDQMIKGEPAWLGFQANGVRAINKDGVINHHLRGKTITHAYKGQGCLYLGLMDVEGNYSGVEAVIGWVDPETGKQIMGEPAFCGQHVNFVLPMPAEMTGLAGW